MEPSPRSGEVQPEVQPPQSKLSRRELLKKAGWVVPAVVALPLVPGTGHAHTYASGGGRPPTPHKPPTFSWDKPKYPKSSWDKPKRPKSSGDKPKRPKSSGNKPKRPKFSWDKPGKGRSGHDYSYDKSKLEAAIRKLLRKWFNG